MRIGLFYQIQVPKPWTATSESERFHEALEQVPYAEQQGFASVWFSEHHFRPVWSHSSAPDLTLAALSQRTSRIRLGIGVVLAPIHHPLHVAARMATLDILSHGRVDVGLGRTGYPYQLTPYGSDLSDTRGMWLEFADVLPRIWSQETVSYNGKYFQIPPREVLPKPMQRPHPPLWSACGSDETAHLTGSLGMGGLFGSEGGPERVRQLMAIYQDAVQTAPSLAAGPTRRAALMTVAFAMKIHVSWPSAARSLWAGTSSNSESAPGWYGATTIRPPCRRIIRATTPATSASPADRIRVSPRPSKCVSRARLSASALPPSVFGSWSFTKLWVSRKCSCYAPLARRNIRRCCTPSVCSVSRSSRISRPRRREDALSDRSSRRRRSVARCSTIRRCNCQMNRPRHGQRLSWPRRH